MSISNVKLLLDDRQRSFFQTTFIRNHREIDTKMGKKAKGKSQAPPGKAVVESLILSPLVETPPGAPFPKMPTIFEAIRVDIDPEILLSLIQEGADVNARSAGNSLDYVEQSG